MFDSVTIYKCVQCDDTESEEACFFVIAASAGTPERCVYADGEKVKWTEITNSSELKVYRRMKK